MARPTTPIKLINGAKTKEEKKIRLLIENRLRGKKYDPTIPEEFTTEEAAAYTWLCCVLDPADILGEPDRETMKLTAITIARLNVLDQMIRENASLLINKDFNRIRNGYFMQYTRLCKELCLSPAARSKIGSMAKGKKAEDPLISVLKGK